MQPFYLPVPGCYVQVLATSSSCRHVRQDFKGDIRMIPLQLRSTHSSGNVAAGGRCNAASRALMLPKQTYTS